MTTQTETANLLGGVTPFADDLSDENAARRTSLTIRRALEGDRAAVAALVAELMPVVHARVGRSLWRRRGLSRGADMRTTLEDLAQDVFVELFRDDGSVLRAWNPERGLTLKSFVGLVAEQRVSMVFRSRRRNPWSEELAIYDDDCDAFELDAQGPEERVLSREHLDELLDEVRTRLSPTGLELFYALVVREEAPGTVAARLNMTIGAVHAWSSRLKRLVRALAARQAEDSNDAARRPQ